MHKKKSFSLISPDQQEFLANSPEFHLNDETLILFRQQLKQLAEMQHVENVTKIMINEYIGLTFYMPIHVEANQKLPVIYYIHGGGFVAGCAAMHARRHQDFANQLGCILIAVDYRLAPENPFPVPLQDCVYGLQWLMQNIEQFNIDQTRISIMGESAGGGLVAAVCHQLKSQSWIRIKNQILIYAMLDYCSSTHQAVLQNPYVGEFLWTHQLNQYAWQALLGSQKLNTEQRGEYSPTYAICFENLPNTFILVGALDLFLEENLDYAKKLSRAGVAITVDVVAGAIHGFDMMPGKITNYFHQRVLSYLDAVL